MNQSTIFDAIAESRTRRDLGIHRAGTHADDEHDQWITRAAEAIGDYARLCGEPFLIEDVRQARYDIEDPSEPRAWGAAAMRAARAGLICKAGYAPSRSSNLSPKVLWSAKRPE